MKVIIIGGVAAGTSAAAKLRRMSEEIEIVLYEKGEHISYATCGLPYYVSGDIEKEDDLVVSSVDFFSHRFNLEVKTFHEVLKINPAKKTVKIKDIKNETEFEDSYDRLLIATGAFAVDPCIEGINSENVFNLKIVEDAVKMKDFISGISPVPLEIDGTAVNSTASLSDAFIERIEKIKANVVIVGAGYIGLELLETFVKYNLSVVIIEKTNLMLPLFDREITEYAKNYLKEKNILILCEEEVETLTTSQSRNLVDRLKTRSLKNGLKKEIELDLLYVGIGVKPDVKLAVSAGIKTGESGAVAVNENCETSISDIYAAGDCTECPDLVSGIGRTFCLASIASKQGRAVAHNIIRSIYPPKAKNKKDDLLKHYKGSYGTAIIKILDIAVGKTGLSIKEARRLGFNADYIEAHFNSHAGYYPGAEMLHMILVYDRDSHKILGFEAIGKDMVDKKVDIVSTAMFSGVKVEELAYMDFAYQPAYGSAKDSINMIGMIAENLFDGELDLINCEDLYDIAIRSKEINYTPVRRKAGDNKTIKLNKDNIFIVDVRNPSENKTGSIEGAVVIPISSLRNNIEKVDKDKNIIIYCKTGYRAYVGYKILKNNGFKNVLCLNGSYLSWSRQL